MPEPSQEVVLLSEIRDLLIPIAHHYRAEYAEYEAAVHRERLATLKKLVRTGKPVQACLLMNGERKRGEIIDETKIDRGDMSRLLATLKQAGFLTSDDDSYPKLIFTAEELKDTYST